MFLTKNKQKQNDLFLLDEKTLLDKKRKFNKDFIKAIGLSKREKTVTNPKSKNKIVKTENNYDNKPLTTRNFNKSNPLLEKSTLNKTLNKNTICVNPTKELSYPNIVTSKNNTTNANTINKSTEKKKYKIKKISQLKKYDNFLDDEEEEKFHEKKEYYQVDNGKKSAKNRKSLLNIANCVFTYNDEKIILNKIKKYSRGYSFSQVKIIESQKIKRYAELQTVPTEICFGKCFPKKKDIEKNLCYINNTNIIRKRIKNKSINPSEKNHQNYLNMLKYGFDENNKKFIINTEKGKTNEAKDRYGHIIYPVFNNKTILKNILPKEIDYNTQRTVAEMIEDEKHPMKRNLKKMLNQNMNLLNQQIEQAISYQIHLIGGEKHENIDLQTQEKFIELMDKYIVSKNKSRKNSFIRKLTKKKIYLKKIAICKKFMNTIIEISVKFKRLHISLNYLNYIIELNKKEIPDKDGQYFFQAIKSEDVDEIIRLLEIEKYNIVNYKDKFLQTPLHICAKRNIYQAIEKFCFRVVNINAQDESGRTPLMLAAQAGHIEFVCILLYKMADPRIKDKMGKNAEDLTNNEIIKNFLVRAKAIYCFFSCINVWCFDSFLRRGVELLFSKETELIFHSWDDLEVKLNIKLK